MVNKNDINFFINYILPEPNRNWDKSTHDTWTKKRAFYSCNGANSYLTYMATGSPRESDESNEISAEEFLENCFKEDYLGYMSQDNKSKSLKYMGKERSRGLFDRDGMCSKDGEKFHRERLRDSKGIIWEGIITFEDDFAMKYCNTTEQSQAMMKTVFKNFLNSTHLKDRNINWIAALHENTDHYHIHYSFYEKEPWRVNRKGEKAFTDKGTVNSHSLNYFKQSAFKYFHEEAIDVHTLRDNTLKYFKAYSDKVLLYNRNFKQFKELSKILNLTQPTKYDQLSGEKRKAVDSFSIMLLSQDKNLHKRYNDTFAKLANVKSKVNEFSKLCKLPPITAKADSFRKDYLKRIGTVVINGAIKAQRISDNYEKKMLLAKNSEIAFKSKQHRSANIRTIKKTARKALKKAFDNLYSAKESQEYLWEKHWKEICNKVEEETKSRGNE